jgi:hypothetical protein
VRLLSRRFFYVFSLVLPTGLSNIILSYVIQNGAQRSEESPGQLPRL